MPTDEDINADLDQDQTEEADQSLEDSETAEEADFNAKKASKTLSEQKADRKELDALEERLLAKIQGTPESSEPEEVDETETIIDRKLEEKLLQKEIDERIGGNEELRNDYEKYRQEGASKTHAIQMAESDNGISYESPNTKVASSGTVDRKSETEVSEELVRQAGSKKKAIEWQKKYGHLVRK